MSTPMGTGQPRPSAAAYITARGAGCKQLRMPQMINVDCLQNPFVAPRPQAYLWQQLVLDQPLGRRRYVLGHGPAIFLVAHNGASLNLAPQPGKFPQQNHQILISKCEQSHRCMRENRALM